MRVTPQIEAIEDALGRVRACSPFLRTELDKRPDVAAALGLGDIEQAIDVAMRSGVGAADDGAALRRERTALALALGVGDLAGLLPLERVVGTLSGFADQALDRAIAAAIAERTPDAEAKGFVAIALGKLGSGELNYSSDIDLLFLYDPAVLPLKPREEPGQGAVRVAQRVVELLQKRDGEGYVFRVDLRLRPSPEVTPIALSADAATSTPAQGPINLI